MAYSLISGFSRLSKEQQISKIADFLNKNDNQVLGLLKQFWHIDHEIQKKFDGFTENTISNYYMPYNIAPNFIINGNYQFVPMVIEESSVVAAASHAAKFWANHGGFHCRVLGTAKVGQIHFFYSGKRDTLLDHWEFIRQHLLESVKFTEENMRKRGGGVLDVELHDLTHKLADYYQIRVTFETSDSMGANFINSCLEEMAGALQESAKEKLASGQLEVLMSILSNYTPECAVECYVETDINAFDELKTGYSASTFARRFEQAVQIAEIDPYRAATHNKGIFNGVDAVVIATGNDFRATEACGHTHAAASGKYRSLTSVELNNSNFKYKLQLPMALGSVGGLTKLHPLSELSLEILGSPSAQYLMMVAASVGLANNFSAVRSLITHGIQKGHMKMHLNNILSRLSVTDDEKMNIISYFSDKTISFRSVELFLKNLRSNK